MPHYLEGTSTAVGAVADAEERLWVGDRSDASITPRMSVNAGPPMPSAMVAARAVNTGAARSWRRA